MNDQRSKHVGQSEPTDWRRALAITFGVSAFVSWVAWEPLSLPGRILPALLPDWNCRGWTPASIGMYFCAASVAMASLVGTFASLGLLWLVRRHLIAGMRRLARAVPVEARFVLSPLVASLLFTLCWAPLHYDIGDFFQKIFPAVVGLFAHISQRHGPALQVHLAARGFYEWRDRFSKRIRIAVAVGIPLAVSLFLTFQTRVTAPRLKEQFVVMLALCTGYLAITPRHGDLRAGIRDIRS